VDHFHLVTVNAFISVISVVSN